MNRFSSRASRSLTAPFSFRGASLLVLATLAATSQLLGGCIGARVIGDDSGDGDGNGARLGAPGTTTTSTASTTTTGAPSTTTTGTTGGGGAGGGQSNSSNIAIFNGQISSSTNEDSWTLEGQKIEPTTLIIGISFGRAQSCANPQFDLSPTPYRQLIFGLSPSAQKVGTYNVLSTDVIAVDQFWTVGPMGDAGGGSFPLRKGSIEVLSIDPASVTVRLDHIAQWHDYGALPDGDYVVTRCP